MNASTKPQSPRPSHSDEDRSVVTIGTQSAAALWSDYVEMARLPVLSEADGWRSIRDICRLTGRSYSTEKRELERAFEAGRMERLKGLQKANATHPEMFYRPIAALAKA